MKLMNFNETQNLGGIKSCEYLDKIRFFFSSVTVHKNPTFLNKQSKDHQLEQRLWAFPLEPQREMVFKVFSEDDLSELFFDFVNVRSPETMFYHQKSPSQTSRQWNI